MRFQRRQVEIDPLSAIVRGNLAWLMMAAGLYEEAEREMNVAISLNVGSPDGRAPGA